MKNFFLPALLAAGAAISAHAAEPKTSPAAEPDPALVDAIVRKIESEGILDRAVERALTRLINREAEARQQRQAQQQAQARDRAKTVRKVSPARDHIRGNPAAEVSLMEYSDFECGFCKRFHSTPQALMTRFGNRVNWVYRHFPLPNHDPAARREAVASECAAHLGGNDTFWKYADALFEHTRSNGQGLPEDKSVDALAVQLGLDRGTFARCLEDKKMADRVEEDYVDGTAAGITGTPTTLIRHNRTGATEVVAGALPAERLAPVIERMLEDGR